MALYDDFPYTNFHSLNLDWIVKKLSELENEENTTEESSSTATLARNLSGNYPYTNFHALNLDWIIRSMVELESNFETLENEWENLSTTVLLNDQVKNAILQCFQNVAWVNEQGQQYYNALRDLFYPPVIVDTLTAVLDQGERVFHTGEDVNVIKDYLTVTAKLTDGTLITVPATQYVLTGSLSQDGPNTIIVTYMNASATIIVNAVAISLVSISAVYTQSGNVYNTDTLDSLKSDLVVTAHYSDSSTATVPSADYTLSGTLTEGTSVITVTYEGMITTFNVTVTIPTVEWDYTLGRLPSENDGITTSLSGNISATFVADKGIYVTGGTNTSNYVKYAPANYTTMKKGYFEGIFTITQLSTDSQVNPRLSNGTNGWNCSFVKVSDVNKVAYKKSTANYYDTGTSFNLNTEYKFKIEYEQGGTNKIYVDDNLIYSTTEISEYYTTINSFFVQGIISVYVKSMKWAIEEVE